MKSMRIHPLGLYAFVALACQPIRLDVIITEASADSPNTDSTATEPASTTGAMSPPTTGGNDGATGTVSTCAPEAYRQCSGGHVYWFDTCGAPGELAEDCGVSGLVGEPYCMGSAIYRDLVVVGCKDAACTSDIIPALQNTCGESCLAGACVGDCVHNYAITAHECDAWTTADGLGPGGGIMIRVCGTVDADTGFMSVRARKFDGSSFGNRPYQVRVSQLDDGACGPNTFYFVVSDSAPTGIGTSELTFNFQSLWEPGQVEKAYCVTASTAPGDPGYDANSSEQTSWWGSDKLVLQRTCK
mgnify:FL=1